MIGAFRENQKKSEKLLNAFIPLKAEVSILANVL